MMIRPVNETDLSRYIPFRLEALREHPSAFGSSYEDQCNDPPALWLGRLKNALDGQHARLFVADPGGDGGTDLAGMTGVYREPGSKVRHAATLYSVYVRPPWRGKGLMDAFMESVQTWARERGVLILRLQVTTTNEHAIRCYERHGFRRTGLIEKYIRTADGALHDEYAMSREV